MIRRRFIIHALLVSLAPAANGQTDQPNASVPEASTDLTEYVGVARPFVIFSDRPNDPAFEQQMRWIEAEPKPLEDRSVIVLTDTDPAANSPLRQRLRPHGFGIVLIDIDGQIAHRRPFPVTVREITKTIDRKPSRR